MGYRSRKGVGIDPYANPYNSRLQENVQKKRETKGAKAEAGSDTQGSEASHKGTGQTSGFGKAVRGAVLSAMGPFGMVANAAINAHEDKQAAAAKAQADADRGSVVGGDDSGAPGAPGGDAGAGEAGTAGTGGASGVGGSSAGGL